MKHYCLIIILCLFHCIRLYSQSTSQNHSLGCTSTWYEGEGTYYGGVAGGAGGHCGIYVDSGDFYHAAMNHIQYDSSNTCGVCVRILGPKGEVTLKIVDECPECKFGDIDMTTKVFPQLADPKDGRIKIRWQYVPCPLSKDITLLYSSGSGPYYFKAQVGGANYPITKVEYKLSDGTYNAIHREVYNYYVAPSGIDENKLNTGPYFFRFTASTGEQLYADSIPFSTTEIIHTGVQFSAIKCPDCAGVLGGSALIDNCAVCSGGTTGITPNSTCVKDCAGYWNGTAYIDNCNSCVAGTTGLTPCGKDCNNVGGGQAYIDHCGNCVGGTTGLLACTKDCYNEWGGKALIDVCGNCTGGSTNKKAITDSTQCPSVQSIFLQKGWNIISLNLMPDTTVIGKDSACKVEKIFSGLEMNQLKNMNAFWLPLSNKSFCSLKTIEPGLGYLINMENNGVLFVYGTPINPLSINLKGNSGWNLIGNPFQTLTPFSAIYTSSHCLLIKDFTGFWVPNGTINSIQNFEGGKGYFLKVP
jgi:expansin (peptidoglycan-binding protein)